MIRFALLECPLPMAQCEQRGQPGGISEYFQNSEYFPWNKLTKLGNGESMYVDAMAVGEVYPWARDSLAGMGQ